MDATTDNEVKTADEAAAFLKTSKMHVLRLARKGLIPSFKLGHLIRFYESDLRTMTRAKLDEAGA
jgi:excisionase family DNA binding protein